jgi:uncharacterized protein YcbK (DUF882 family)
MIPQTINPGWDHTSLCNFAAKWGISPVLAAKLQTMASRFPHGVQIISGWRSAEKQMKYIQEGKGAPLDRSTHVTCPATGADLWPLVAVTDVVKAVFGEAAVTSGLRWGGGSPVDTNGIPSDWNHVDLGPR